MSKQINLSTLLLLLLAVVGCGDEAALDEVMITGGAQSLSANAITAGGLATSLGAPLVPEGLALYKDRLKATEADGRARVEKAISGNSVVTDKSCVTYNWKGLSGTVAFLGCTLEVNGKSLDGTVNVTIVIKPDTSVTLSFTQLKVGSTTFSGSLKVGFSKAGITATMTADLSYTSTDGKTTLTLKGITVAYTGGVATINGQGHIKSDKLDTDFTAANVSWKKGDCLPSAGTLTMEYGGATVVITFLSTTPQTGKAQVQIGNLPPTELPLSTSC